MKPNFKIYTMIALLIIVQACGSMSEKNSESAAEMASPTKTAGSSKIEERRAAIKKDSALIAEKRLKDWNALVSKTSSYKDEKGTIIYYKAEVDPSFLGGNDAMMKYLRGNIIYPEQAEKDQLEGTVFVDFVIGLDGAVNNVEVTNATSKDVDQAFRNEAIRLISSMPKWTPGSQNNKPVNVRYSIPITFQII